MHCLLDVPSLRFFLVVLLCESLGAVTAEGYHQERALHYACSAGSQSGNHARAIRVTEESIELDPDYNRNLDAYLYLIYADYALSHPDWVEQVGLQVVKELGDEADPRLDQVYVMLGAIHSQSDRFVEAIGFYEKVHREVKSNAI